MSNPKVVILDSSSFEEKVLQSKIPVLVDFWAEWCGPCRAISPVIDEIANEYDSRVTVCKLNVDSEGAIAANYGVMSIPTLLLFKDGQAVERMVGARPKQQITADIDKHL